MTVTPASATPESYLTSDWGMSGNYSPTWWTVEDREDRGWEDVGVGGPGPDRVLVPETVSPGDYLVEHPDLPRCARPKMPTTAREMELRIQLRRRVPASSGRERVVASSVGG
jgi:hypothetical protein